MDIDVELSEEDVRHVEEHSLAVGAVCLDRRVEEEALVHVPLCVEDAVAEAGLELGRHGT